MPTTKPVPSADPADLPFNAGLLDTAVNSGAQFYVDRLGAQRLTVAGAVESIKSFNSRGAWASATAYAIKDLVSNSGVWYVCVKAHTSAGSFGTDLATKWRVYQGLVDGEVSRFVDARLDFGAAIDGSSNDLSELNAALADFHHAVHLEEGDSHVPSAPTDVYGPDIGPGRVLEAVTGGRKQVNLTADRHQHVYGQEYLYAAHNKLMARNAFSALFSGDSTTAGSGLANTDNQIHSLVQQMVGDAGYEIAATNAGHSGAYTEQWRTDYLAGDLASNPDLYVIRWGINDPAYLKTGLAGTVDEWEAEELLRRDVGDYATSLRAALTTIRAAKAVSAMSIILMVPNSTSDTPNGRDEKWYEQIRRVCRKAARDFQCALIDTYAMWPDTRSAAGRWMDNPYSDGRAIHPLDVMNKWIAGAITDLLVPGGIAPRNIPSTWVTPAISEVPKNYPIGVSSWRVTWTINGVSVNGALYVHRSADNVTMQTVVSYAADMRPCVRVSNSDASGWREWVSSPPGTLSMSNGWSSSGRALTYDKQGGQVCLTGRIAGGTATPGTTIATLPSGYRPAYDCYFTVLCGTALTTVAVIAVTSAGAINVVSVSDNARLDLSGCHFTTY